LISRCPDFHCNGKIIIFCLELGGHCTRGPQDFAYPAHPIVTPLCPGDRARSDTQLDTAHTQPTTQSTRRRRWSVDMPLAAQQRDARRYRACWQRTDRIHSVSHVTSYRSEQCTHLHRHVLQSPWQVRAPRRIITLLFLDR